MLPTEITERPPPRPQWVAAFMSAHSKTPYITPSMGFPLGKGWYGGAGQQQLEFTLAASAQKQMAWHHPSGVPIAVYVDTMVPRICFPDANYYSHLLRWYYPWTHFLSHILT